MSKWAIAHISFYDNELRIEIVESDSWHGALSQHSQLRDGDTDYIDYTSLETAKKSAFDQDAMVDVIKIPD